MSARAKPTQPPVLKAGQVWQPADKKSPTRRIVRIHGKDVSYRAIGSLSGGADKDGKSSRERFTRWIRESSAEMVQTPTPDTPPPAPKVQTATSSGSGPQEVAELPPWSEPGDPSSES